MTGSTNATSAIMAARSARNARARRISTIGFLVLALTAFVTTFGIAWAYVAGMPMAFLDVQYALWVAKRSMRDSCQADMVAVFGDSRALASTMPRMMTIPVKNFAMSGTTPIETYFSVERALQCPSPPKLVVISHTALKFASDPDYWNLSAKFGLFDYSAMRAVDADAARLHDHEIEDLRRGDQLLPALREWLFTWHFPPFYFDSLVHGFVAGRWALNRVALQQAFHSSGHALLGKASGSSEISPEGYAVSYRPSPIIDLYFSRTLAMLQKRGIPAVFLTMPVNHATYTHTKPRFRSEFAAYLRTKAEQYPILRVADPVIPCWPDRFFGDLDHFNARGAEAYSRELDPWLRRAIAGNSPPGNLPNRCVTEQ